MIRLRPRFPVALATLSLLTVGLSGCSHVADVFIVASNHIEAEVELLVTIESAEGEEVYLHNFKLNPPRYPDPEEDDSESVLLKPGTYVFKASTGEFKKKTTQQVSGGDYWFQIDIYPDRVELAFNILYTD